MSTFTVTRRAGVLKVSSNGSIFTIKKTYDNGICQYAVCDDQNNCGERFATPADAVAYCENIPFFKVINA